MILLKKYTTAVAILVFTLCCPAVYAKTLRLAHAGDTVTLDPHSFMESVQLGTLANVFEPLVTLNQQLQMVPGLAIKWEMVAPTVWHFTLREGVQFHDGTPFTADDVVFSLERARSPVSDIKTLVNDIKTVRALEPHKVEIETTIPYPILPNALASVYMMSKKWCEENQATEPVDRRKGVENAASFKTNGTGPYKVTERQPNVRTVFERNDNYWGKMEGNVRKVIFTPIANDATRVAALLSGGVDVMEPVPVQDTGRINANPTTQVLSGPEIRVIFLGMDQKRDALLYSSVKGKNPLKDQRVRQAFYQAIDIEGIKKTVMRNTAIPTANMVTSLINGFQEDMKRLPYDVTAAKKLMQDAGYADGFELTMNCPNDRYMNDSRICQTVAANLSRIGVKVTVQAETKAIFFARVNRRDTSFYLFGWVPGTYDGHNTLHSIVACNDDKGAGQFNMGSYCNPKVDELIRKIQVEINPEQRNALFREAFALHAADVGHIPLHEQTLAWGVSKKVKLVQRPDNFVTYQWIHLE